MVLESSTNKHICFKGRFFVMNLITLVLYTVQISQCLRYVHSCLVLDLLITISTNKPSQKSLEYSAKPCLGCQSSSPGLVWQQITEYSRNSDFQLWLLVLILSRMASCRQHQTYLADWLTLNVVYIEALARPCSEKKNVRNNIDKDTITVFAFSDV